LFPSSFIIPPPPTSPLFPYTTLFRSRHRFHVGPSQRDVRAAQLPRRQDRLLLPERRARARTARAGGSERARRHLLRLDRKQGGRLVERPARVVGGRRRDRARRSLPRVLR